MSIITPNARRLGRADKPHRPGQRRRANFARAAVFAEFGYRHGRALDYDGFADRLPAGDRPRAPAPTAGR